MDKLKLVKTTVFAMTFLLVLGTLMPLGSIFKKTHTSPIVLPTTISLNEPAGSGIKEIVSHGDNLYLLVQGGGQSDRVVIFNPTEGHKLSTLNIN